MVLGRIHVLSCCQFLLPASGSEEENPAVAKLTQEPLFQ